MNYCVCQFEILEVLSKIYLKFVLPFFLHIEKWKCLKNIFNILQFAVCIQSIYLDDSKLEIDDIKLKLFKSYTKI